MTTDTFTRSTAFGLDGSPSFGYTWNGRDTSYGSAGASGFFCNGSAVQMPASSNFYDSYTIDWAPDTSISATVSFDWTMPVLTSSGQEGPSVVLRFGDPTLQVFTVGIEQDFDYDTVADPHYFLGSANSDGLTFNALSVVLPVTLGSTYTVKMQFQRSSGRVAYKMWETGTTEPDWQVTGNTTETSSYTDTWIDFWFAGDLTSYLDNLTIDPNVFTPFLTAQAVIVGTNYELIDDTFTRSVTHGLGGSYIFIPVSAGNTWGSYNYNTESSGAVSVDGTKAVIATSAGNYRAGYFIRPRPANITFLAYDFYVPATFQSLSPIFLIALHDHGRAYGDVIQVYATGSMSPSWQLQVSNVYGFNPSPSTWYTTVIAVDNRGTIQVYITLQGDTEDNSILNIYETMSASSGLGDAIQITNGATTLGLTTYLDNLRYWSVPFGFTADAEIFSATQFTFSANAGIRVVQTHTFTADAVIAGLHIRADAFIVGNTAQRHFQSRDHIGTQADTFVQLDTAIGQFGSGTLLREVLVWLFTELPEAAALYEALGSHTVSTDTTSRNRHTRQWDHTGLDVLSDFVLGAPIGNPPAIGSYAIGTPISTVLSDLLTNLNAGRVIQASSVFRMTQTGSFTAEAQIGRQFVADAVIIKSPTTSFTADAVIAFTFRANSVLKKNLASSFTANAVITKAAFKANAVLKKTTSKTFTSDGVIVL